MADETNPAAQPAEDTKTSEATAAPNSSTADADQKADVEKKEDADKPAASTEDETKSAPAGTDSADKKGDEADKDQEKPAEADAKKDEADGEKPAVAKDEESTKEKAADDDVEMATEPAEDKGAKGRRKSGAGAVAKNGKKLNKKASKAKILNVDAKPGDYFYTKLKGYPWWPTIVCDEDMLSRELLNKRPVSAASPDGTYREDFADGGKRVGDRSFAVMFLHTNEFSWVPNTDLRPLDTAVVESEITDKMRKDLQAAHHLAAENNDLDYFKNVLREFEEARTAKLEKAEAKAAAKVAKTPRKSKAVGSPDQDGDLEMVDMEDDVERSEKKPKTKKRKAEDEAATPARSDSVKKPKIKLTGSSTPKAANGTKSPLAKDSVTKSAKSKPKAKNGDGKKSDKNTPVPKEPELTPEERRQRKEKEILFLRHRLQRGLISKDGPPKEEEMSSMSEFLGKLEQFPDLEASIIRATKINKVLKAIIKLNNIPKETELKFKPRSQTLLDKWNAVLAADEGAPASAISTAAPANGINGQTSEPAKAKETSNGTKEAEPKSETDKAPKETSGDKAQKDASEEKAEKTEGEKETESKKTPEKDEKTKSKEEATTEKDAAPAAESTA